MLAIFLGILALGAVVYVAGLYNGLVRLWNQLERAWANIDVVLKQRHDEIPQLVLVLEQYSKYEADLIRELSFARAKYGQAASVGEKISASSDVSQALRGVFAIGENYPELRSNQNFVQLQSRISGLEESLADRRETYNDAVANLNTRIEQLPDLFMARLLNYSRQEPFKATSSEKETPSLKIELPQFGKGA